MKKLLKKVFAITVVCVMTVCMCMSANAAAFVGSVEQKAPSVSSSFTDDNGNTGNVLFTDEDGNTTVPDEDIALEVTDLLQVSEEEITEELAEEIVEIKERLESAEKQVAEAESVTELVPELEEVVNAFNQDNPDVPDVEAKDLVVLGLFDVSLVTKIDNKKTGVVNAPAGSTSTFEMSFQFDIPDLFALIHEHAPGEWRVEKDVEKVGKRTLRCTVSGLSPFALVVDKSASEYIDVDVPQEGITAANENVNTLDSDSRVWLIPVVGVAVALSAVVAVKTRKKVD